RCEGGEERTHGPIVRLLARLDNRPLQTDGARHVSGTCLAPAWYVPGTGTRRIASGPVHRERVSWHGNAHGAVVERRHRRTACQVQKDSRPVTTRVTSTTPRTPRIS